MKKTILATILMIAMAITTTSNAQVGIGVSTANINPSAQLDVTSTTKGLLPPRMTTTQRDAINTPASGLVIFNTTTNSLEYKSSTGWVQLTAVTPTTMGAVSGSSTANGGTITSGELSLAPANGTYGGIVTNGTQTLAGAKTFSAATQISNNTNSTSTTTGALVVTGGAGVGGNLYVGGNTAVTGTITSGAITYPNTDGTADQVLKTNGSGTASWATASSGVPYTGATGAVNLGAYDLTVNDLTIGKGAGGNNSTNTAIGNTALTANTSGIQNTAVGYEALKSNTTAGRNTAIGYRAMYNNTASSAGNGANTAVGYSALYSNIMAWYNTAIGYSSMYYNTTGNVNAALGMYSLHNNTSGSSNTGVGVNALFSNTSSSNNTGIGFNSLYSNTGSSNTATGYFALKSNTSGGSNTAFGYSALNTNSTGSNLTAIGNGADVSVDGLSNSTAIGDGATVDASNKIQLGNGNITNVKTSGTITAGTITYPNTDGTANQVLSTNGSGIVSWATASSGVSSIGAIGGSSTSTGASISGSALSLTPADGTNGGIVTNAAQTFAGVKTFNNNIVANGSVGVGTANPSASAQLEVNSTTQGFLPPRMTLAQREAIVSPAKGLMLYCTDCGENGEPEFFNGSSWMSFSGKGAYPVGNYYQGGIIFYILSPSDPGYVAGETHGLIAATEDQIAGIQWYNGSYIFISAATGTTIGTGLANTNAIIATQGATATNYAAGLASAYNGGGYTDWYLPSKEELNQLYINKQAIGGFTVNNYWSSSCFNNSAAWKQSFDYGARYVDLKYASYSVRAIRSF